MKRFLLGFITIFFLLVGASSQSYASHAAGAEIYYQALGNNQYRVIFNLYADCRSVIINNSENIKVTSLSCNRNINLTVTLNSVITPQNIPNPSVLSYTCTKDSSNIACFGGTLPGVKQFQYTGVVTLPFACSDWMMSWQQCCGNSAITNLQTPANYDMYVETKLNTIAAPNSSSTILNNRPTTFYYSGEAVLFDHGGYNPNGDSLVYKSVNPLRLNNSLIPYLSGFSPAQPMATTGPFTIDSRTGQMSFTPNGAQTAVITILVEAYRQGILISSVMRDMQVNVLAVSGSTPTVAPATINNLSVIGGVVTGPYSIEACAGSSLQFSLPFAADTLTLTSITPTFMPTVQFSSASYPSSQAGLDSVVGTFNWTPTLADTGIKLFSIAYADTACPVKHLGSISIAVTVKKPGLTAVTAGSDKTYCTGSAPVSLNAVGTGPFSWSPSVGLSDTTIANPTASPTDTTDYIVTAGSGACAARDTVRVSVLPIVTTTILPSHSINVCGQQAVPLSVAADSLYGPYTYSWLPSTGLNTAASDSVIATASANTLYKVTVTSANGCIGHDSVQINVSTPLSATIQASHTTLCVGDTVNLSAIFANAPSGVTYTWLPTTGLSSTATATTIATVNKTTTYTLSYQDAVCSGTAFITLVADTMTFSVTGDTTLCSLGSVPLHALGHSTLGNATVTWNNGSTLNNSASFNPIATPAASTTYVATFTDGVCTQKDSARVNVGALSLSTTTTHTINQCGQQPVPLAISADPLYGPYTYRWTPNIALTTDTFNNTIANPSTSTLYHVSITSALGCTGADSFQINIHQLPTATLQATRTTTCVGDTIGLSSTFATPPGALNYLWVPGHGILNLGTAPTEDVYIEKSITYTLKYDDGTCFDSVSIHITADTLTLAVTGDTTLCLADTVQLHASALSSIGSSISILWSNAADLDNASSFSPLATPLLTTTYLANVTDGICSQKGSATIKISPLRFEANTTADTCGNGTGQITARVVQGEAPYTYTWSNNRTIHTPLITDVNDSLHAGAYTLHLTDANGCVQDSSFTLTATTCDSVWPGDANRDGVVDATDVISFSSAYYGDAGVARLNASNVWVAQYCQDWSNAGIPGNIEKHMDCDGNGVIDLNDTLPVSINYGLTHSKTQPSRALPTDPTIAFVPTRDTIAPGDYLYLDIVVGTSTLPVDSLCGLACSIGFDAAVFDTSFVLLKGDSSWLGTMSSNLFTFHKSLPQLARIDMALGRYDRQNGNGFGKIGQLVLKTLGSLPNGVHTKDIDFNPVVLMGNTATNAPRDYNPVTSRVTITDTTNTGISQVPLSQSITLYPNPSNGHFILTITQPSKTLSIELLNVQGQMLHMEQLKDQPSLQKQLNFTDLAKGVYLLKISTENGVAVKRMVIQ